MLLRHFSALTHFSALAFIAVLCHAQPGVITTVIGTGVAGASGDGGPGGGAQLSMPNGVAVDAAGSVYIADYGNSRIRKVLARDFTQTIAGCARYWIVGNFGSPEIPREWLEEFEAAAKRPLEQRLRYAFIHTYKPVLDDEAYRSFDTMEEYRAWCEKHLPDWLGYGRV